MSSDTTNPTDMPAVIAESIRAIREPIRNGLVNPITPRDVNAMLLCDECERLTAELARVTGERDELQAERERAMEKLRDSGHVIHGPVLSVERIKGLLDNWICPKFVREVCRSHEMLRAERDALTDDPELDCTDAAHPAWWRGESYGHHAVVRAVTAYLDGKPLTGGKTEEGLQAVIERAVALRAERDALAADRDRLDWLDANHIGIHTHAEPCGEELSLWFTCCKRDVTGVVALSHPFGRLRQAIDAARGERGE